MRIILQAKARNDIKAGDEIFVEVFGTPVPDTETGIYPSGGNMANRRESHQVWSPPTRFTKIEIMP